MSHSPEEERLLDLLQSQHAFPMAFPIKIMFRTADTNAEILLGNVQTSTGVRSAGPPEVKVSSKGTYTSLTVYFQIGRPEQVIEVYRHLATVETVVSYF